MVACRELGDLLVAHREHKVAPLAYLLELLVADAEVGVAVAVDVVHVEAVVVALLEVVWQGALYHLRRALPDVVERGAACQHDSHAREDRVGGEVVAGTGVDVDGAHILHGVAEGHGCQAVVAAEVVLAVGFDAEEGLLCGHVDDVYRPRREARAGLAHHEGGCHHVVWLKPMGDVDHLHALDMAVQQSFDHAGEEAGIAPVGGQCHNGSAHFEVQRYELNSIGQGKSFCRLYNNILCGAFIEKIKV